MDQHDQLRLFIDAVRRRWFADEAMRVIGLATGAAALPALAGLLLYVVLGPGGGALVLLACTTTLAALAAVLIVSRGMHSRPDDRHVARFVEERAAELPGVRQFDDALVTAVDSEHVADPGFRRLLVAAASRRLHEITPAQIVPPERLRRRALMALGGVASLSVLLVLAIGPLRRAAETAWILFWPNAVHVQVLPGDRQVVAGQPLEIRAVVRAGGRILTSLTPELIVSAGDQLRTVAMNAAGDGYAFPFESVDRTFRYKVSAGRALSREYTVSALMPPRIERIELRYQYPPFTGLRPRTEDDGGDIYAPAGTKVRVRVHADKPVVAGNLVLGEGGTRRFSAAGDRVLESEVVLARDDSYRVTISDGDGLRTNGETEYFIRLMDDRPPDVRILRPAGDQQITPLEEVAIEARAEDDYGIAALELVYAVPGGVAKIVPFARTSGTDVVRLGAHLLAAEDLNVKPGDVITYYARARDVGRGKRPTETRSDMYFLEVRPFSEEFVASESQAGGGGAASQQIESLIAAQKEIIAATWNIERRSDAGRSAQDVQAVAQAQAELKSRAEQMLSRRSRGRYPYPQRIQLPAQPPSRPPSGDPVANAIREMQQAVERLQGERTRDALPHEMAALKGLLQAQAEIRRREVMQQQANGPSGGSGRQGEDLSALFDKELQRNQRTNYETRSQIDERPDPKKEEDALDRIRDLAKRQEEIRGRAEELARAELTEERKRELERLTREQNELREQIEELARRSAQQNAQQAQSGRDRQKQQGGQGAAGQTGAASAGMKEAGEQMRAAANDLDRHDPKAAADQAARAAERLRDIERQMRSDSPEARQRAAGELQLEAQQIAEEQRRIAAEAGRLDAGKGAGNADARRRLSGEKEQLADRVDALERGVADLARADKDLGIANAARELEREQIGRRMREGARQIRDGGGGAAGEQQLAQALDTVVQQLGAGTAQAREAGEHLDRTRAIRNRLDHLERQMTAAEAREQAGPGQRPDAAARGRENGRDGGRAGAGKAGGAAPSELQQLRQEYAKELQQARESLGQMQQSAPRSGAGGTTPEKHEWSQADPGTQGFKQDFSAWQTLRKDINLALERTEARASARLAQAAAQDRLSAGGSDRVPDAYRKLIARYYESLARPKK
jgi:hypothetical protein